jgi:hypothetical protein
VWCDVEVILHVATDMFAAKVGNISKLPEAE